MIPKKPMASFICRTCKRRTRIKYSSGRSTKVKCPKCKVMMKRIINR